MGYRVRIEQQYSRIPVLARDLSYPVDGQGVTMYHV